MNFQLNNKKAFISGSTKGIGFATAKTLAQEGVEVIINGRNRGSVDEALEKMAKAVDTSAVSGIPCDFSKPDEVERLIETIGSVDILVNNVGIFKNKDFPEITDADWEKIYQVNVMSGIRLSRAFLPKMFKNDWGRIIFISSESAINIPVEMVHYGVSKTAILGLSRGIAKTTEGTNVTVNSVLPGPTLTDGIRKTIPKDQDFENFQKKFFKTARPTSILKRFADPQEVANMITYVASPRSSASNGASLRVDAGVVDTI